MVSCPDCRTLEEILVLGNSKHNAEEKKGPLFSFDLYFSHKPLCFKVFCTPIKAFGVRTLGVH